MDNLYIKNVLSFWQINIYIKLINVVLDQ